MYEDITKENLIDELKSRLRVANELSSQREKELDALMNGFKSVLKKMDSLNLLVPFLTIAKI